MSWRGRAQAVDSGTGWEGKLGEERRGEERREVSPRRERAVMALLGSGFMWGRPMAEAERGIPCPEAPLLDIG